MATTRNLAVVLSYGIASIVGALVVGAALGRAGQVIAHAHPSAVSAVATGTALLGGIYGVAGVLGYRLRVPASGWGIPRGWSRYGAFPFAMTFGLILGAGFITQIPYFGYYVITMGCVGLKSPLLGALVMGAFGVARGAAVPVAWIIARRDHARVDMHRRANALLRALVRRLDWWASASLCGAAVAALWTLL